MKLNHVLSGELIESEIEALSANDFQKILSSKEFSFNLNTERTEEVYKIYLIKDKKSILGLVSLIDMPDDYRIHLNLLEVSKSNQGK